MQSVRGGHLHVKLVDAHKRPLQRNDTARRIDLKEVVARRMFQRIDQFRALVQVNRLQ